MNKILLQAFAIVALFFATWLGLTKIDWLTIFKVEKVSKSMEEKLGDLFWESYSKSEKEIHTREITAPLDSLLTKICASNGIDRTQIKMHVLRSEDINAFALPNKHLVIYSGLISNAENEAELCGVICHELAHIQKNHVMKKLINEIGLSVLISMTTGGNSEIIKKAAKLLSSSAYDRSLEKEADIQAVDYLVKAEINPEGLADFLFKIAEPESTASEQLAWISTHPDSRERAAYILAYSNQKSKKATHAILSPKKWEDLKKNLGE